MSIYKFGTFEELIDAIDIDQPVFADTETCGLYGKFRLLQCYQADWEQVIIVDWPTAAQVLTFQTTYKDVWHNSHYDLTCIQQNLGKLPIKLEPFFDTFFASRVMLPQYEAYSLDAVMTVCNGHDPYIAAGLDKKKLQKSNWNKPKLSDDQLLYAAIDVYWMPRIYEQTKEALDHSVYKLDVLSMCYALQFQWNGMPVDSERHDEAWIKAEKELSSIPMPINARSWQQVRKWLGVDESDDKFLAKLEIAEGNEEAGRVRKVRKLQKLLGFLQKYDLARLIGKFKPSARSGRFTSDDENLQQIPRALKKIFGFRKEEDRTLIYSDYAQIELRTICAILGVALMEKLFRAGTDVHGYVASIIFGEDWTKDDRQVTKTYNFNLLYGGSVGMVLSILLGYGFMIKERVANGHKRKWLNLFPEINSWQQKCIASWRKGKLNSTPLGRRYKGKLMTDFMNIMNQGAGAEVAKLALHYFYPWLEQFNKDNNTDVKLCNFIHDSFILDSPRDPAIYEPVSAKLAECMQEAWFEMSKLFKIKDLPMPVDVIVGDNWGDLENGINVRHEFSLEPYKMLEKVNASV